MPVLIDVLGAVAIGGLVLIMLITFNYQITETAERQMYERFMTEHIEEATKQLNYVMGMSGLGIDNPDNMCVVASDNLFMFKTLWDHVHYQIGQVGSMFPQNVSIALYDNESAQYPKVVEIRSSPPAIINHSTLYYNSAIDHVKVLEPFGFIFWVDDLEFRYYDIDDNLLTGTVDTQVDKTKVRAVELLLTFRRDPPRLGGTDLTNRVQLKCYLMNTFMNS